MLRLNLKEQALFFNQMATLMKAGVPITKSIKSIEVTVSRNFVIRVFASSFTIKR
ncbi:MAG: hypothetical protein AB2L14_35030 [Candidatus Xenobiia bacterium LiM19]